MVRWILAAAVLMTAVPADAESWHLVEVTGSTPDRNVELIADTIDRTDPAKPRLQTARLYEEPDRDGVSQLVFTHAIDCANRVFRVVNLEVRDANGVSLDSQVTKLLPTRDLPIRPDTEAEIYHLAACQSQWHPSTRALGDRTLSSIAQEFMGD